MSEGQNPSPLELLSRVDDDLAHRLEEAMLDGEETIEIDVGEMSHFVAWIKAGRSELLSQRAEINRLRRGIVTRDGKLAGWFILLQQVEAFLRYQDPTFTGQKINRAPRASDVRSKMIECVPELSPEPVSSSENG
ncbi:MAG: hypothetical protein AAFR96_13375 [Planctomycetota bacterium]